MSPAMRQPGVRLPAVAGAFYPADAAVLRQQVLALLGEAPALDLPGLKLVIVPHAGYIYSGPTAASLYSALLSRRRQIRRVILLGPAHRVALSGMAIPASDVWASPLGVLPVDAELKAAALSLPGVVADDAAHAQEHALEVQLPFLQSVLGEISLLPVAVGQVAPEQVAGLLSALWGGPETLILLSTDLSHYLPAGQAEEKDRESLAAMLAFSPVLAGDMACGARPANGLFIEARRRGLRSRLIDYRHSGDTAGDRERVVGYAAIAGIDPLAELGELMLRAARLAIEARFGLPGGAGGLSLPEHPAWRKTAATFVTLTRGGRLRGCIGSLMAHRTLLDDLLHNAAAAAFGDPRFSPLGAAELADTRVEVSLLSAPQALPPLSEPEVLSRLRPGVDGVILSDGPHRATYLPQVWAQLPDPAEFLANLKEKAGLPRGHWGPQTRLQTYTVEKWKEP